MPGKEITDAGKLIAKQVSAELATGNYCPSHHTQQRPNTLTLTYTHTHTQKRIMLQFAFLQQRGKNPDPQQWQWTGRVADITRAALS